MNVSVNKCILHNKLLGHAPQTRLWTAMRREGTLPHALLLTGPSGIGKRAWARAAAQDLLCLSPGADGACGRCASCEALPRGAHPDLLEVSPALGHRQLRAEEMDEALDWLALTPALSARKVLVQDQAEAVTHGIAPAFLKVIEEPPAGTHFLLVTARPKAIVPTIASRCRRLPFSPLTREQFRKVLAEQKVKDVEMETLYRLSRGSPGEALRLKDERLLARRADLASLLGAPHSKALAMAGKILVPPKPTAKEAAEMDATPTELRRREALERLQILVSLLRDRLPGVPEEARLNPDLPSAPGADVDRKIRAVTEAMDTILANADLTLALECCALELAAAPRG